MGGLVTAAGGLAALVASRGAEGAAFPNEKAKSEKEKLEKRLLDMGMQLLDALKTTMARVAGLKPLPQP